MADEMRETVKVNGEPVVDTWLADKFAAKGALTATDYRSGVHWQVDHKTPIAVHWQTIGHNTNDAEREAHAMSKSNLQLISRFENLSAGSSYDTPGEIDDSHRYRYQLEVGKNFTTTHLEDDKWRTPRS